MKPALLFIIIAPSFLYCQQISFVREEIVMTVEEGAVVIQGTYWFANTDADQYRGLLFYPFPVDRNHPFPDSISVTDGHDQKIPLLFISGDGVSLPVSVDPFSLKKIIVRYRQRAFNDSATYILTSTKQWRRPLREAAFCLILSNSYELKSISYTYDDARTEGGIKKYFISKTDFMPVKDLIVSWKRRFL